MGLKGRNKDISENFACFIYVLALIFISCESREEKFERETRENLAILEKIKDSADEAHKMQELNDRDEAIFSALDMYEVLASAYYLETKIASCDSKIIGYRVPESVVTLHCSDGGVAIFSAKIGACRNDSITVTPIISNDDIKYDHTFSSPTCEKSLRDKMASAHKIDMQ